MDLDTIQTWAKILESWAKIFGLIVAAAWGWLIFIKKRQKYPRANISHQIEERRLTPEKTLIRLSVEIKNIGDVLVEISSGEAWVQRVRPLADRIRQTLDNGSDIIPTGATEVEWPLIDDREMVASDRHEIEPGETDYFDFEFTIDSNLQTILVYSYLRNETKKRQRQIGWRLSTLHDLITTHHDNAGGENGQQTPAPEPAKAEP